MAHLQYPKFEAVCINKSILYLEQTGKTQEAEEIVSKMEQEAGQASHKDSERSKIEGLSMLFEEQASATEEIASSTQQIGNMAKTLSWLADQL